MKIVFKAGNHEKWFLTRLNGILKMLTKLLGLQCKISTDFMNHFGRSAVLYLVLLGGEEQVCRALVGGKDSDGQLSVLYVLIFNVRVRQVVHLFQPHVPHIDLAYGVLQKVGKKL